MTRVIRHVSTGSYPKALDLLRSAGAAPQLRNALGVCLLRLERYEDATRILRDLVLSPGCTWVRPDVPTIYRTNFATALLLDGHPAGCQEILSEVRDSSHPAVQRLHAAMKRWEAGLPFSKKTMWRIGRIEPSNAPVTLDFPPGDFDLVVSSPGQPPTDVSAAAVL